jgi:hypothetical protein
MLFRDVMSIASVISGLLITGLILWAFVDIIRHPGDEIKRVIILLVTWLIGGMMGVVSHFIGRMIFPPDFALVASLWLGSMIPLMVHFTSIKK